MVSASAQIKNKHGIHVRPSRVISEAIGSYDGQIMLTANDICINTMNMINILSLGLQEGDIVEISVEGAQEQEMIKQVIALLEEQYDFPGAGSQI